VCECAETHKRAHSYTHKKKAYFQNTAIQCNTVYHTTTGDLATNTRQQHTATHCNTLQHATPRCNTLQLHKICDGSLMESQINWPTSFCNRLQHAATRCNTLQLTRICDRSLKESPINWPTSCCNCCSSSTATRVNWVT